MGRAAVRAKRAGVRVHVIASDDREPPPHEYDARQCRRQLFRAADGLGRSSALPRAPLILRQPTRDQHACLRLYRDGVNDWMSGR